MLTLADRLRTLPWYRPGPDPSPDYCQHCGDSLWAGSMSQWGVRVCLKTPCMEWLKTQGKEEA